MLNKQNNSIKKWNSYWIFFRLFTFPFAAHCFMLNVIFFAWKMFFKYLLKRKLIRKLSRLWTESMKLFCTRWCWLDEYCSFAVLTNCFGIFFIEIIFEVNEPSWNDKVNCYYFKKMLLIFKGFLGFVDINERFKIPKNSFIVYKQCQKFF